MTATKQPPPRLSQDRSPRPRIPVFAQRVTGTGPRVVVASATRCTASPYDAMRRLIARLSRVCHASSNARATMSWSLALTSSSRQKYSCRPCTHSKYETTTPPAFARTSGQDEDAAVLEDRVGGRRDRPVRAFADHRRLDAVRVRLGHDLLEGTGGEDVAGKLDELLVRDGVRARKADERPVLLLVRQRGRDVETRLVVHTAARVGRAHDLRAFLGAAGGRGSSRRSRTPGSQRSTRSSFGPASSRAPGCSRAPRERSPPRARASRPPTAACPSRRRAPSGPCSSNRCRRSTPSRVRRCRRPAPECPAPARCR